MHKVLCVKLSFVTKLRVYPFIYSIDFDYFSIKKKRRTKKVVFIENSLILLQHLQKKSKKIKNECNTHMTWNRYKENIQD